MIIARCRGCVEGWRTTYEGDGRNRLRIHRRGERYAPGYQFMVCTEQGWRSRHPYVTFWIATAVMAGLMIAMKAVIWYFT